eukprot:scaffold11901_cov96-Isochrysis_galbana.AAC.5
MWRYTRAHPRRREAPGPVASGQRRSCGEGRPLRAQGGGERASPSPHRPPARPCGAGYDPRRPACRAAPRAPAAARPLARAPGSPPSGAP